MPASLQYEQRLKQIYADKAKVLRVFFERYDAFDKLQIAAAVQHLYVASGLGDGIQLSVADGPSEALSQLRHHVTRHGAQSNARPRQALAGVTYGIAQKLSDALSVLPTDQRKELQSVLFWDFNFQLVRSVAEPIHDGLLRAGYFPESHGMHPVPFPGLNDADWIHYYSIIQHYFPDLNIEVPPFYADFLLGGGGLLYAFPGHAVVCTRPSLIRRDEHFRLHGEEEAAVEWLDGSKLYFHHGVHVPAKLMERPDEITREDIAAEQNAEVRRCYQEILGSKRFADLLGLVLLDKDADRFGNDLCLYRTEYRDKLAGSFIYFAQVTCPSTQRRYFLCVPPTIRSAKEAVAWSFGKSAEDYHPDIET